MRAASSLTEEQRSAAVALFGKAMAYKAVSSQLGVGRWAVRSLYRRWRVHGAEVLVEKPTKTQYSFEVKLDIVQRFLAGTSAEELVEQNQLSSRRLLEVWVQKYRRDGEDGLRPKPKGRPPKDSSVPRELTDLEQLQRENLRLRAENAYLKKLRALKQQGRR
ncbi:MAG: helix-turn-helix domain-containing protein [Nocardiaceae bacterium]|nr:helix-turn-helix domain-containing protein [Nocardiaceae bacterium]